MKISKLLSIATICTCSALLANEHVHENHYDITVTANKMREKAHEIPQSITIIDEESLKEKNIKNIKDVIANVPNISSMSDYGSATMVNVRGINSSPFTQKNPIIIYVDGVPVSNIYIYEAALANAKRVEVLREPSGTLYGKDAIGGVINIVTKKPRDVVNGGVGLEYSSKNTLEGKFNIQAPIMDEKLYFGLNARGVRSDGYVTDIFDGKNKKAGKNSQTQLSTYLLARPNDRLSLKLSLSRDEKIDRFSHMDVQASNASFDSFSRKHLKHRSQDIKDKTTTKIDSQSLDATYNLPSIRISSTLTHQKSNAKGDMDGDYGTIPAQYGLKMGMDINLEEYTGEVKVSNKNKDTKWVVGLYADREKIQNKPIYWQTLMPNNPANPAAGFSKMSIEAYTKQKANTKALFGQVKLPIYSKLSLTLGARVQRFQKKMDSKTFIYPIGFDIPKDTPMAYKTKKTWNAFLPKVALSYKLNEHLMPYASFSTGYMHGGFNHFSMSLKNDPNILKNNTFEPEKSKNYTIGLKGSYENFNFNANIFRIDIKDIHVFKLVGNTFVTDNANKAHSQGLEFDFNYYPIKELELSGGFGYTNAKYDDFDDGLIQHKGEKIETTPTYTGSLGLGYYAQNGIYARVDGHFRGKTYFYNMAKNKQLTNNGGVSVDLKLGYKLKNFDIYAYGTNITNNEHITSYLQRADVSIATFNKPRMFGLGVDYRF